MLPKLLLQVHSFFDEHRHTQDLDERLVTLRWVEYEGFGAKKNVATRCAMCSSAEEFHTEQGTSARLQESVPQYSGVLVDCMVHNHLGPAEMSDIRSI